MVTRKPSRHLILALASLALVGGIGRLAAQHPPAAKPLTIAYIAEERDRNNALPGNLAWSPDGKTLGFILTAPRPGKVVHRSLAREIWSIDAATGQQKLLVSAAEVTAAFGGKRPHVAPSDEEEDARRRQLQDYAWAPGGHLLLLATGASLARFDLDAHSSRPLVTDRKDLGNIQISPDGRTVSFLEDHSLWLADASTGAVHHFAPAGNSDLREGEADWDLSSRTGNAFGLLVVARLVLYRLDRDG